MPHPYAASPATQFVADRIRHLAHRKTQREIAAEAGFVNPNMLSMLKSGKNKIPLDRVPSLAKPLESDAAYLMRLAIEQAVGATAAKAISEIFGTPATEHERGWLAEIRDASDNSDPQLTARSRTTLRRIFGK